MTYIDLTQAFIDRMPVYPGDSETRLVQSASVEKEGYAHFDLTTGVHTGTHIDGPMHMLAGGAKLLEFPLDTFFGPGVLVDVRGKDTIDASVLSGVHLKQGSIVLLYTGFDEHYHTPQYFVDFPELTEDFGANIIASGASMVGVDSASPDRDPFLVHKQLLGKNVLIIENLTNLSALVGKRFEVIALPLRLDADSSLARVVAKVLD